MTDLSPRARDVLASARAELAPDAERIARGRERLLAATAITAAGAAGIAAAHAATTATAAATVGPGAATTGASGFKLALVGAGVVVVVAGAIVVPRLWSSEPARPAPRAAAPVREPLPTPDPPTAVAIALAADEDAIDPSLIELVPDAPRAKHPRVAREPEVAPAPEPAPAIDPLKRELDLLKTARAGLRSGAIVEALSTVATYQREFPRGQLAEDAAALEIDLLCAAGRTDEADRKRARFVSRWPSSTLPQRVERACKPR